MSSHHAHDHSHFGSLAKSGKKALITVLAISAFYMVAEVVAGMLTGSLALIADAGHMLGDVAALTLALLAAWFASRPASKSNTYGYFRSEILAALLNGMALLALSGFILYKASFRIFSPTEVLSGPMLVVAILGLGVNLLAMRILAPASGQSLNMKAAYLEVLADMLGSVAVIGASILIMLTGWTAIDPIVSAVIGLAIVPRTWLLVKQCVHILMEGTPSRIELDELRSAILAVPGVVDLHDLHVWSITSRRDAMSAHAVIVRSVAAEQVLTAITDLARERFDLHHTTIQVESRECSVSQEACH
ncbi:MAG: cation transporter [Candidatus Melainabacteria bacterium]|nr:cation transporter [Candidatus Melainabacteria bacterium]